MGVAIDYKKEIINITRELPKEKIREVIDFARFLKAKKEGFSYTHIDDSVEYVKKIRIKEGRRAGSGKKFIKELMEWQKSNS